MPDDRQHPKDNEALAGIPDLSDVPLEVLFDADDSPLSNALQRLLHHPSEQYAAHGTTPD